MQDNDRIEELKKSEKPFSESELRYPHLIENMSDADTVLRETIE